MMKMEKGIKVLKRVKEIAPRLKKSVFFSAERGRIESLNSPTSQEVEMIAEALKPLRVRVERETLIVSE